MKNKRHAFSQVPRKFKQLNQRPKVTIAIGLISKGEIYRQGAIIFASDSQTTFPGGQKRLDAKKINVVEFMDAQILVAQSGSAELSDKAIDMMRSRAKDLALDDEETAPRLAASVVREIRNHFLELNKACEFSAEEWARFFSGEAGFTLMLGFYFNGNPFIYEVDISFCMPIRKKNFHAIGCGKYVAELLLKEYESADPDFECGYPMAISVIQKTIDNVEGCHRPVWTGCCYRTPPMILESLGKLKEAWKSSGRKPDRKFYESEAKIFTQEEIGWVVDSINEQEKIFVPRQKEMMLEILQASWKRRNEWASKILDEAKARIQSEQK